MRALAATLGARSSGTHVCASTQAAEVVGTLNGHTGQVTCVKWLPAEGAQPLHSSMRPCLAAVMPSWT